MKLNWLWVFIQDFYILIIFLWLVTVTVLKVRKEVPAREKTRDEEQGRGFYRHFIISSFLVYVLLLLYVTLLGRTVSAERSMELSFLWEYELALNGNIEWVWQILSNIFLFLPMGWMYGAHNTAGRKWYKAALIGCAVSLGIELCQLGFRLGLFEFDDILNNTIGMLVGYGLFMMPVRSWGRGILRAVGREKQRQPE